MIARGSGCDFVRTFCIPKDTDAALEVAANGRVARDRPRPGRATSAATARRRPGYYCNIASAGLTGVAADRVNRSGKPLGRDGRVRMGRRVTFFGYRNAASTSGSTTASRAGVQQRDRRQLPLLRRRHEDPADGGSRDGLLDVLVWGDVGKVDLALNLHRLYRGTHVNHPKAEFSRARRVVVEPETPLPIEADGEQPGMTPATFEIVPAAVSLRVPR